MTEPTDAEIDALLRPFYESDDAAEMAKYDDRLTARAVLAKWGTPPAVAGEPVGWMWQHEETGRTGFVDCWQVENGWQENNPRLRLVSKLYTSPPAVATWRSAVLDLIDECPGLTMEQDHWLSRRVKEMDFISAPQPTQAQAVAVLTADDLKQPRNGKQWLVEWWNESCRMLLPVDKKLDRFQAYRNGTLMFTIKDKPGIKGGKPC